MSYRPGQVFRWRGAPAGGNITLTINDNLGYTMRYSNGRPDYVAHSPVFKSPSRLNISNWEEINPKENLFTKLYLTLKG